MSNRTLFAGGPDFDAATLAALGECVERRVGERYGLEVRVKAPRGRARDDGGRVRVERWQVVVVTAPARPDLPAQRIVLDARSSRFGTRSRPDERFVDVRGRWRLGSRALRTVALDSVRNTLHANAS